MSHPYSVLGSNRAPIHPFLEAVWVARALRHSMLVLVALLWFCRGRRVVEGWSPRWSPRWSSHGFLRGRAMAFDGLIVLLPWLQGGLSGVVPWFCA